MVKDLNDPTNVDSVPAMLTPGEFVLNKEATQMFGPLIQQMNDHGLKQRMAENKVVTANAGGYMPSPMGYNTGGLVDFLKKHEGWRDKAYQDSAGVWTIGYGRTRNADGSPIKPGQTTTKEAENTWIQRRAKSDYDAVKAWAEGTGEKYSPKELEALASFRYNLGPGGFNQLTGNGTRNKDTIKAKLPLYNKAGGRVIEGLNNRRSYELDHAGWGGGQATESSAAPASKPAAKPAAPLSPTQAQRQAPTAPSQAAVEQKPKAVQQQEAAGISIGSGAGDLAELISTRSSPIRHSTSRRYSRPEYVPSVASKKENQVRSFNNGGWLGWRGLDGEGLTLGQKLGQGTFWGIDEEEKRRRAEALAGRPGNRNFDPLSSSQPPASMTPPPNVDNVPLPGSDEALLQGSSDVQENQPPQMPQAPQQDLLKLKAQLDAMDPDAQDAALNQLPPHVQDQLFDLDTMQYQTDEALRTSQLQQAVTAPDAPGAPFIDSRVDALTQQANSLGLPPEQAGVGVQLNPASDPSVPNPAAPEIPLGPNDTGVVPGIDQTTPASPEQIIREGAGVLNDPDALDPRKGVPDRQPTKRENIPATREAVTKIVNDQQVDTSPEEAMSMEKAGEQASPSMLEKASSFLKDTFGDLFDKKELMRAAVLFAGARLTGASSQKALAIAGKNYLSRLDAKEAAVIKSKEAQAEAATKAAPYMTGEVKTVYKNGKKQQVREVKSGPPNKKTTTWVDGNGHPVNLGDWSEDGIGSPDWKKNTHKTVEDTMVELSKAHVDADGKPLSNILPKANAAKITEWAAKNGVKDATALSQLVQSAYAEVIESGDREARDLVPALEQLVLRQKTGNAKAWKLPDGKNIDSQKIDVLNDAAANKLRSLGLEGNNVNLANTFYNEALADWNELSEDEKKSWERRAGNGTNGFYAFAQNMLTGE